MLKIFHFTNFIVKPTTSLKFKGLNKGLKNILAYVRHGPGGGELRGKILYSISCNFGHSESILNFCKNDVGEGSKIRFSRIYQSIFS